MLKMQQVLSVGKITLTIGRLHETFLWQNNLTYMFPVDQQEAGHVKYPRHSRTLLLKKLIITEENIIYPDLNSLRADCLLALKQRS